MCGIVGYIGNNDAQKYIISGLKRLEYRGYDSAGISLVEDKKLVTFKREGKLENLIELLNDKKINSVMGIGHTRWATHGEVNANNAHPHSFGNFSIVHNGIIENSEEIKKSLTEHVFVSETDSEVFLALFISNLKKLKDNRSAFIETYKSVRGHSAFVLLSSKTEEIFAIRKGAPLVCGKSHNNYFVSSDPYGLVKNVDEILFPDDEVVCHLTTKGIRFTNLFGEENQVKSKKQDFKDNDISKGDFDHYMLKEIFEQPLLIEKFQDFYLNSKNFDLLTKLKNKNFKKIYISACGTAYYASLVIRDIIEAQNRVFTCVELASEFRYRNPILSKDDLAIFISQSGETADTLASQELCIKNDLETWSIVNVEGSSLYRNSAENFPINAGIEIGVASTKAFSMQVLTGYLISNFFNYDQSNVSKIQSKCNEELKYLSIGIKDILDRSDEVRVLAEHLHTLKGYFFTGRGIYYPIALEGALKLKEIAYVHAEGYAAGELKHGPIALIDENMVNIAFIGPELQDKTISNIKEIKTRKGIILTVGDIEFDSQLSDFHFKINSSKLTILRPILYNIFNQLFAYYIAKLKGTDIDQPRNLAKSVTVE